MKEEKETALTDEYLESLRGMKAVDADPFFYTRLKGRMLREQKQTGYFYKPAWTIITLCFFLAINIWMVLQVRNNSQDTTEKTSSAQAFAETYNLNNESNY